MRVIFKLCFATTIYFILTAGMFTSNASAQSSEYAAFMQAKEVYCAEMAGMECGAQRYYQYLNMYAGLPIDSMTAFRQYCKNMTAAKVCLFYCNHDSYCHGYQNDREASNCAMICSNRLGELYSKTPEYAKEKAEEELRKKQKAEEMAKRAADAKIAQEKREAELERQRQEEAKKKAEEMAKRAADAKIAQEKRKAELERQRQEEAEKKALEEKIRIENERIERENRIARMEIVAKEIRDDLITHLKVYRDKYKSWSQKVNVESLDGCVCMCASADGYVGDNIKNIELHDKIRKFIKLWPDNPGILASGIRGVDCREKEAELKRNLDKYRADKDLFVTVCDNICPEVIDNLPKESSIDSFFRK